MPEAIATTYRRLPEEERRQLLIEVTIRCLSEFGLNGTTVRRIANKADVAPNLITHHFSGKDVLISAAYRYLAEKYHAEYRAASEAVEADPIKRLQAYVGAAFHAETLNSDILRVWTSFWTSALTDSNSTAARVHLETAGQTRDYLKKLLRDVLVAHGHPSDDPEVHDLAIFIWSLVDGMWLTWGLDPSQFSAQHGRRIVFEVMAARMAIPELKDI